MCCTLHLGTQSDLVATVSFSKETKSPNPVIPRGTAASNLLLAASKNRSRFLAALGMTGGQGLHVCR